MKLFTTEIAKLIVPTKMSSSSAAMALPEEMASKTPFPPTCPVYIHEDETDIRFCGTVKSIYIHMSSLMPDMFYDVQIDLPDGNSNDLKRVRGPQLRYQNGCGVTVKIKDDSWPGVVLGTCDVPDNDERRTFSARDFWYSVQLFDGSSSMIEHEIMPSAVSFRAEPYSPEDDTEISSLENGPETAVAGQDGSHLLVKDDPEQSEIGGGTYIKRVKKEIAMHENAKRKIDASSRKNLDQDERKRTNNESTGKGIVGRI